jgi:hypothetical protein
MLIVLAAALASYVGDPWRLFTLGMGLAAAAVVAPRLAASAARPQLVGAVIGALAFGILLIGDGGWLRAARPLVDYPALVAAPLAWLAARVARRHAA